MRVKLIMQIFSFGLLTLIGVLQVGFVTAQDSMDVYDAALWSVIGPLSEWSVADKSQPIAIPDFTKGIRIDNAVHVINLKTGRSTKVITV